ncbi:MAG: phosphatase PAP2 family protein [Leptospirales bacterium]|nr:phosphatase PAP2 family protein [Leptospirales bacterium]
MIKYIINIILLVTLCSAHLYAADSSPYRLSVTTDSLLIGSGAALYALTLYTKEKVDPLTDAEIAALTPGNINKFDRSAADNWSPGADKWSSIILTSTMISPLAFVLNDKMRNDFIVLGVMYGESLLITNGLNKTIKDIVQRKRPFTYNSDAPYKDKKEKDAVLSFYSGHTANAFNSAVFVSTIFSDYYPHSQWRYAVWGTSLLAASGTGYLRYYSGKHYPTDIIAGAIIGSITGWAIPALHRNSDENISVKMMFGEESMLAVEFYF